MRVFVPIADEWDSGMPYAGEAPVPYRAGLPLWREPVRADDPAPGGTEANEIAAPAARAA
ncbi:MAG TPA: hypothetical protein VND91_00990 [Candidatus Saccharimonadia bacterium]|nr:hypothetical protein [Candidatus Saccharimonadia bacterium]